MDRRQRAVKALALTAALLLIAAAPSIAPFLLREQSWTAPGPGLARAMTHAPGECVATATPETEIGRALFRSPGLLGGPVGRLGMSCNSCHSNGRVNAAFLLPELTNRTGAADVTSEWASHVRGDGVMNPVDIPDLAGAGTRESFGHVHDPSLEHFSRSVVVDEFQGHPPPDQAFAGLIAYLRALDSAACAGETRITLATSADDVRRALTAATTADAPTADLLVLAAQDGIGRIVERLPVARFASDRARFEALALELVALRNAPSATLGEALPGWRARFDAAVRRVARRERQTYFNETTLRRALER